MIREERVRVGGTFWITEYVASWDGTEYHTHSRTKAEAWLERRQAGCVGLFHSMVW